jgi:hypothetical protein
MMQEDVGQANRDESFVMMRLGLISSYLKEKCDLEDEVARLSEIIKDRTERVQEISSLRIPEVFDELGLSEVRLSDGTKVFIKTDYAAAITKERAGPCFTYLKEHQLDGIIKNEVVAILGKNSDEKLQVLKDFADKNAIPIVEKRTVHPQTLKALVKEQIDNNTPLPEELFSIFKIRSTVTK